MQPETYLYEVNDHEQILSNQKVLTEYKEEFYHLRPQKEFSHLIGRTEFYLSNTVLLEHIRPN